MKELISIIVPSYKRNKAMVKRAIDSLLSQTYDNIEIVIVDDNGKKELAVYRDQLVELIFEYNSKKIVYIQNESNMGGALSRNVGIENSSGEYITFLDDDDKYLCNKIEKQLSFMIANELDMSFTEFYICNGRDKVVDYRGYSNLKSYDFGYLMAYHLTRQIAGTNTFMYKKSKLLEIGCFVNKPMGQEYYLMYNTIKSKMKIGCLKAADLVLYREGQDCISTGTNKINGQKALYAFKKQNFEYLNFSQKKFVKFRNRVVMAVAFRRNRKLFRCLGYLFLAVALSPITAMKESISFLVTNKRKQKELSV